MATFRSRMADLQVPISRIQSLATAINQMIDDVGSINDAEQRTIINHIANFADLIFNVATETGKDAEEIEVAVERLPEGRA